MCEPVSASTLLYASLGASALTTGLTYMGEKQQYKAQQATAEKGKANALDAYRSNVAQTQQKTMQQDTSMANQSQQITLEARRKAGDAIASSNASGLDLTSIQSDYLRQEANYKGALQQQNDWEKLQNQAEQQGYMAQAKDRIASYIVPTAPSLAGAVAGFGAKAIGAYSDYSFRASGKTGGK